MPEVHDGNTSMAREGTGEGMTFEEWFDFFDQQKRAPELIKPFLKAAWEEGARQEREACALIAEADARGTANSTGIHIAFAIRMRGKK